MCFFWRFIHFGALVTYTKTKNTCKLERLYDIHTTYDSYK